MDIWKSMFDGLADSPAPEEQQSEDVNQTSDSTTDEQTSSSDAQTSSGDDSPPPESGGYKSIVGEDFTPPSEFESPEMESNWYKQKFEELSGALSSEKFYDTLFEAYKDQLLAKEQEVEEVLTTHRALKENPRDYIRQFFPESLAELGISPVMKDEEIASSVDQALQKEFGADYKNVYNVEDLAPFKGNTLTRQIFNRGNELHDQFSKLNEKNRQIFEDYTAKVAKGEKPIDDAQAEDYINEQYSTLEKQGVSRADYDAFIQELKSYHPTVEDFWKLKNLDKTVEAVKKQAYEEGRKAALSNINKVAMPGNPTRQPENSPKKNGSEYEDWTKRQLQKGMGFVTDY